MGLFSKKTERIPFPEIGKEIKWTQIVQHIFKIVGFDKNGTRVDENGNVKARNMFCYYGYLTVMSPILNTPAYLPIVHKTDFQLASLIFDDKEYLNLIRSSKGEILVTYIPKNQHPGAMAGIHHALHYGIAPEETLNKYYSYNNSEYMTRPQPAKLFGGFEWDGEIRIKSIIGFYF